jgi:hypothetical protein
MYDSGKVIIGIIVFVLIFSSPLLMNLSSGDASYKPEPKLPDSGTCIESREYMKDYHMEMLNSWRDMVVRQNIRFLKTSNGKYFEINGHKAEMSLIKTCMNCHNNKAEFCDRCHNYLDVKPYCWDCHIDPSLVKKELVK